MKKYFLFAAVVATGMLASCSSDSLIAGPDPNIEPTQEERVPIEIGVASVQTKATTRGIGTVGGTTVGTNVWKGEKVNVFMFDKNKLDLAEDVPGSGDYLYNDVVLTTPNDGSSTGQAFEYLTPTTIQHKYYPQGKERNFDFWGYYVDDANVAAVAADAENAVDATSPQASEIVNGDQDVIVPFIINGTQDLMVAKAYPNETDAATIATWGDDKDRFYSAFAARRNIQPELSFKHLLTRLTFTIQGGNDDACGYPLPAPTGNYTGVFVKSITIKSQESGYIVAAYTRADMTDDDRYEDPTKLIKFYDTDANGDEVPDNYVPFNLTSAGGRDLYSFDITDDDAVEAALDVTSGNFAEIIRPTTDGAGNYDEVSAGDAMLVQPRASYVMEIELGQYLLDVEDKDPLTDADDDGDNDDNKYIIKSSTISNLPVTIDGGFKAGNSYNVNVTVWGYEEIKITTTLEKWADGGNVNVEYD